MKNVIVALRSFENKLLIILLFSPLMAPLFGHGEIGRYLWLLLSPVGLIASIHCFLTTHQKVSKAFLIPFMLWYGLFSFELVREFIVYGIST